ncbi:MAG: ABC transporter substrate-binding protein [Rhodocyclales bacterium]|nr:ABC transporter substrate-binding protein [Rhodocyclales bacterium]
MLRCITRRWVLACALFTHLTLAVAANELPTLRVGALQYGTVMWSLDVMQRHGLAEQEGVRVEVVPMALKESAAVALQGGAVDVIVTDWLWVARQRAEGRDYTFVPYSRAVGGVMVRPDAGVDSFADLRGRRLGVAGGALDKSWLLLRAYGRKTQGVDAAQWVDASFAAPPLLNALMLRGELPATLNFWHYAARLRAGGMRELLGIDEVLRGLGVAGDLPMLGWVFRDAWAVEHGAALEGLLRASTRAGQIMRDSDVEWQALRPLVRADDDATLTALRDGFRAGIPLGGAARAEGTAQQVFRILAEVGGAELVGSATALPPGTFHHREGEPR